MPEDGPTVHTKDDRIDTPEDVRCWAVHDDDLKDEDDLDGGLYCTECITDYVGTGEIHAVAHDGMWADAFCDGCDAYLGDDDHLDP